MVDEAIKQPTKDWKVKDDVICYLSIASTKKEYSLEKQRPLEQQKRTHFYSIKQRTLEDW